MIKVIGCFVFRFIWKFVVMSDCFKVFCCVGVVDIYIVERVLLGKLLDRCVW